MQAGGSTCSPSWYQLGKQVNLPAELVPKDHQLKIYTINLYVNDNNDSMKTDLDLSPSVSA
jgi:hypothetical protein